MFSREFLLMYVRLLSVGCVEASPALQTQTFASKGSVCVSMYVCVCSLAEAPMGSIVSLVAVFLLVQRHRDLRTLGPM